MQTLWPDLRYGARMLLNPVSGWLPSSHCWIPVWRATKVDPLIALRRE